MKHWEDTLISPEASILDAIQVLAKAAQVALVVTPDRRLIGTITDGDIRRAILRGLALDAAADTVANRSPQVVAEGTPRPRMLEVMKTHDLRHLPMVDGSGVVIGLALAEELVDHPHVKDNPVVLMAGGLGTRLRPLTEHVPKPLLSVGGRPILEILLERLASQGFRNFFVSVNYKAAMIRDHFGDGETWGVDIRYIEETERLGTAGPLRLLPSVPEHPVLVMNGDLITGVNAASMLDFHQVHGALATMGVRDYEFQVPFGVVETDQERITGIVEKPTQRVLVNGGVYCLAPAAIERIPPSRPFDMTDLFAELARDRLAALAFPIHEHWLDVGRLEDLERARALADEAEGA